MGTSQSACQRSDAVQVIELTDYGRSVVGAEPAQCTIVPSAILQNERAGTLERALSKMRQLSLRQTARQRGAQSPAPIFASSTMSLTAVLRPPLGQALLLTLIQGACAQAALRPEATSAAAVPPDTIQALTLPAQLSLVAAKREHSHEPGNRAERLRHANALMPTKASGSPSSQPLERMDAVGRT